MKNTKRLGQVIKELRLKNDLSLRDLEKKSGVSYSFISSIENDRYQASRDKIISLANALEGSDVNQLLLLAGFAPEENIKTTAQEQLSEEQAAFEEFINNPEHGIFFKDYLAAPEERREEMRQIFKILLEKEKDRKPGQRQGE